MLRSSAVSRWLSLGFTLIGIVGVPAMASAAPIVSIVVDHNSTTTDETVRYLSGIEEGDDFDVADIDAIKTELVTTGLFKSVEIFSRPVKGGVEVVILVEDKHPWVIAPTFYNQPTNVGGGVGFGHNNLFGENKKLLIYAQGATGDSFFVGAYIDPNIGGSPFMWQWDVYLRTSRFIEYAPPTEFISDPDPVRESRLNYLNSGLKVGVTLFRAATLQARIRGAYVFYDDVKLAEGASLEDVTGDPMATTVPEPGTEGWDFSAEAIFEIDRRAKFFGLRSGNKYVLTYERALPEIGSDFDYWYAGMSLESSHIVLDDHNLIAYAGVGYGRDLPFQHEYTAGGTALRGYVNNQFRGDFKARLNLEYSVPMFTIKGLQFRALGFFDSAYVSFQDIEASDTFRNYLPGHGTLGVAPWKNSVGIGTRVFLKQIVLPLLGVDVGYGLESGAIEIYLAIGLTD